MFKCEYTAFRVTPNSGTIAATQSQTVRLDFYPRDAPGIFQQLWEMETRADSFYFPCGDNSKRENDLKSYQCKMTLCGMSTIGNVNLTLDDDVTSRKTNRILKSKQFSYSDLTNVTSDNKFKG